jgi:nucleoside-diphosphate-sugar epimerase
MRCVVTGAAGFIGSTLSERLIRDGHEVVGVDCFTDYYERSLKERNLEKLRADPKFTLKEVDLGTTPIEPILDGAGVVFHQAAQAGVRASWGATFASYVHHNVLGTQRVLEAVKSLGDAGPKRVVYASSSSVYGDGVEMPMRETAVPRPFSPYGVTKLAAEHLAELYRHNFGVSTASLRYFTVYGPRQRPDMGFHKFIKATLRGEAIPKFGDGGQTRDFTFIDDAVEANVLAGFGKAEGVFNVGGGSRVTLNEVLATLGEVMGTKILEDDQGKQAGDVRDTFADPTRIKEALGWEPKVKLREGLEREVAFLRELYAS